MHVFGKANDNQQYAVVKKGYIEVVCETLEDADRFAEAGDVIICVAGVIEKKLIDVPVAKHFNVRKREIKLPIKSAE